ncbi:MAG TPA: serine hydrolase [Candidatus Cybelea sp.]
MTQDLIDRPTFLYALAGATLIPASRAGTAASGLGALIERELARLPGPHGAAVAISKNRSRTLAIRLNSSLVFLAGSAFKIFVLTRFLQMVERGEASLGQLLSVDESVLVPGSPALFPDGKTITLRGALPARIVAQLMIDYSDNTATDMMLKLVGPDSVRSLIAGAGLTSVKIPDSIRRFFTYSSGYPASFEPPLTVFTEGKEIPGIVQGPARDTLNDAETTCGSLDDYATFYRLADSSAFFRKAATLTLWRALTLSTLNARIVPLGSVAYTKGGSVDGNGATSALLAAGRMYTGPQHIVDYAIATNWHTKQPVSEIEPAFVEVCGKILKAASLA